MKYKLLKGNCILSNKLYYDEKVSSCAGINLRYYISKVTNPTLVTKLEYRYMVDGGLFNIKLEDGRSVFAVDITKLLIEKE